MCRLGRCSSFSLGLAVPPAAGAALILFPALLFADALACQSLLRTLLLAGLHIEAVLLDLLDDVGLLHFPLESPEGVFECFSLLDNYFSQSDFTPNPIYGS